MSNRKNVALLIETSNAYARGILRGVNRFQQVHQRWSIFFPEQERGAPPPAWLRQWDCDGLIARIETPEIAAFVQESGIPTVDVSAARLIEELPWVETNDEVIGQLGAQYLIGRGFRHLAFYHVPGFNWSLWRCKAFVAEAQRQGMTCDVLEAAPAYTRRSTWLGDFERLAKWLPTLPRPAGIMACYDIKGRQVLEACSELEIAVPEEIAVLAVDNDPLICEATYPPLTSISLNSFQAGYLAATLLNKMMSGQEVTRSTVRIDPIEIVERLSTDTTAVEDPMVAQALEYIREHATENIKVADVVEELNVSRRKLERQFKNVVGHTPHQEIQRRRLDQVKRLLQYSDFSIGKIAELTGYEHPEYLSVAFQRETKMKLTEFREAMTRSSDVAVVNESLT